MEKANYPKRPVFTWKIFLLSFSFLIAISPVVLYQFYRNARRDAIRQNRAFASAAITQLTYQSRKGRDWYKTYAVYQVGGTAFTCFGKAVRTLTARQRRLLVGRHLPVIYDKTNPANGQLLSDEGAFNRYGLDFPDSLDWTKSYFID